MTLKVSAISKRFGNNWAVRDASFEVGRGTIFGICGPSGSGKSTILRILAGKEKASSGSFDLDGTPISSIAVCEAHNEGSFLNIFGGRKEPGGAERTKAIKEAIGSDAAVVIFDESFSHLDDREKLDRFAEIRAAAEARYILYATASFDDVLLICDQAMILDHGEVIQTGSPEDIYCQPDSFRTANLTGRINLFEARRLSSSKAPVPEFQTLQGEHRLTAGQTDKARLGALNQNVLLGIRPEYVSISFGASFPEDNLLKATITGVRFLGPNTLVECDAGGLRIDALVMRLVGLSPGDECMLGMPPERISVFAGRG